MLFLPCKNKLCFLFYKEQRNKKRKVCKSNEQKKSKPNKHNTPNKRGLAPRKMKKLSFLQFDKL